MSFLYPTLSLAEDETPEGFVSRLARFHGRPGRLFCTDLGLTISAISTGRPQALDELERLASLAPGSLRSNAFLNLPGKTCLFRGETLTAGMLRRERVFVCPRCIADDISRAPGTAPILAAHDRAIWKFASVRTCPVHRVELVECGRAQNKTRGDFVSAIEPALPEMEKMSAAATPRPPSSLEVYVVQRLKEGKGENWIDGFDLHTLTKFCELAGAIATKGHAVAARSLTPQDWQIAGGVGFDAMAQGPSGIEDFVSRMWRSYPQVKVPNQRAQAVLGILHEWLRSGSEGQRPIRELIYNHVVSTTPVGPGDEVLGHPVVKRRLHSIYTAHKEFGVHPKRLRKLLALAGVISEDHVSKSDHACHFDAETNRAFLVRIASSMSLQDAEDYLGAGRVHTKILFDNGFIKPFVSAKADGVGDHAFAKEDLDAFLERLGSGAVEVDAFEEPIYSIADASRRANRSSAEVVAAVLDGRLKWRGRSRNAKGFASILVNLDEVRRVLADPIPDAIVPSSLHERLSTSARGVVDLIREGIFRPIVVRNPKNRCPMNAIPRTQVDVFSRKYVSLYELARELDQHPRLLKYELRDQGLMPAFSNERIRATFYRRTAVARVVT